MFAVIFRAIAGTQDEEYKKTVARMREFAFEKYGCLDFVSVSEGKQEIAISYWKNETSIKEWKNDYEHILAQALGKKKWYEAYVVEVVEIKRKYEYNA